jgi:hypothetical protein
LLPYYTLEPDAVTFCDVSKILKIKTFEAVKETMLQ